VDEDDGVADEGALSVSGEAWKLNSAITGYIKTTEIWWKTGSPTVTFDHSPAANFRTPGS
jgi:hypothetical protein